MSWAHDHWWSYKWAHDMIIPKEQRLCYEYRNYHHYAAIILELGTVGKILVTASILYLSNFKFQEFIMMSTI